MFHNVLSFLLLGFLTHCCAGDKIDKNEMGMASSTDRRWERCVQVRWGSEGKRPLARSGICWRIILRWNFRKQDVGIWTGLGWPKIETGGGPR
jgi:hypothetical protein